MKFLANKKYVLAVTVALVLVQVVLVAPKVFARAAKCTVETPIGTAVDDCKTFETLIGPGRYLAIHDESCYQVTPFSNIYVVTEADCRNPPFNIADATVHTIQCPGEEPKQVPITQTESQACGSDPENTTNPDNNSPTPTTTPAPTPAPTGTQAGATGNAPTQNNAVSAGPVCDYTKPLTDEAKKSGCVERQGGFESTDPNCDVGTQGHGCAVTDKLNAIANVLSAGVGVIIVIMIIIGGIQYSMSGSDPQAVASAKGKIMNAILALIAFFFLYAFLQWIIPGGI